MGDTKGDKKMGDGGVGDAGALGTIDFSDMGAGAFSDISDATAAMADLAGPAGAGPGPGPGGVATPPIVPPAAPAAAPAAAATSHPEQVAGVKRKARRRSLLSGEEGGLTDAPIYRRSILGR